MATAGAPRWRWVPVLILLSWSLPPSQSFAATSPPRLRTPPTNGSVPKRKRQGGADWEWMRDAGLATIFARVHLKFLPVQDG